MDPLTEVVVGELVKNIISILQENIHLIKGVKKDAEKLSSTLSAVQEVLENAEATQFNNKPITDWLRKLKDATYDAEDLLEDLSSKAPRRTHMVDCSSQVSHSISTCFDFNYIIFRRKIAKKLKSILGRFDEIADERIRFGFKTSDHVPSQTESELTQMRETSSHLSEPKIYGRDEDIIKVIDMLLDQSKQEDVFILPIVGFGGVGKTTLAQLVYNNERVVSFFDERIWVCVSDPFDVKGVLKQILQSFGGCKSETLDSIENEVVESLKDKKYLLVLDDVWTKNQAKWNKLRSSLTSGARGSSIMVTTRFQIVASTTSNAPPYNLGKLSNEQCWSLLKRRALGEKGEDEHPELVPIGIEIAEKCKGLPLAAKSLGSLLEFKTNKTHWEHVRDNPIWNLKETEENTLLPALRLSYNHLPSRLKQCFSHCSIYPKDSKLNRIKLIYFWMANGFIQSQGSLELEDVGEDIFHELLRLSFFQDTKEDDYGNIITCKMHDLMHDLACSVTVDECLIAEVGRVKDVVKTIRHLTMVSDSEQLSTVLDPVISSEPSFRSLFFCEPINFHSFKFSTTLRVLNLMDMGLTTLPNSMCKLKHLRFLDLCRNSLESLPESISRLRNLQMLDLSCNEGLTTLPLSIGTLQQLRYLSLDRTSIGLSPKSIDILSNLENLRYLDLSACGLSTSLPESTGRLKKLQRLDISWNSEIKSLPISIGNMESLRHLDLSGCRGITSLPESVGGLRNLHSLILSECKSLEVLPKNMLQSLRHLDLKGTANLSKMPVGLGESTWLQTLNRFVVGWDSECGGIKELNGLNQLRGELCIEGLENVRNAEDAKEAKLSSKRFLKELGLEWGDESNNSNSKEVLEGLLLQAPPNLQKLRIHRYPGAGAVCFPQGLNNSLVTLEITKCPNLTSLSEGVQYLTSLERLEIKDCVELELETEDGCFQHLTSLSHLKLEGLPKLRALPQAFQHLTSLRSLHIGSCQNLTRLLPPGMILTSISEGLQYLTSLKELRIDDCVELELETEDGCFQHLTSLSHLKLWDLPKLRTLELPQYLQNLSIGCCENLRTLPDGIQHLQSLSIDHCENLRTLPDGIQHLTTLQYLSIYKCHEDLHTRCQKEKGEHLFSHIRRVEID